MKLYEIKAVSQYLKQFNFIKKARRIANNTIELNFGQEWSIFFDLTRGNSTIYKAPLKVFTPENDKIIIFKIKPKSQYKDRIIYARFELTGRYTNLILTDGGAFK